MSGLPDHQDAYGHMVWDHFNGIDAPEIVEREDGFISPSGGPPFYFAPIGKWPAAERKAMRYVRGRVLDVGAGAGRVALHLQERGHDVVAIDNSPLAVKTCRARGIRDARVLSVTQVSRNTVSEVATIVMFGNNFGLFGSAERAAWLLRRFAAMTPADGRILAETLDVYETDDRDHLRYQRENRKRGRMSGQIKIRVRYRTYTTPWFDYLMVSKRELERLLRGTGWGVHRYLDAGERPGGYIAVIEKEPAA